MPMLNCYVDDETKARLDRASAENGRPIEELAESLIAEGALDWERGQKPHDQQREMI